MYAYCGNNPANCKDTSGHSVETAWDLFSVWLSLCDVIENPDDLANWLGLGLDLVDLIPLLSGCGEAYRAYRTADRILEGFGNLSKAKEYGIMGYNALRKLLSGTGLEAHHIVEKRLVQHLGIDINNMLSVAVTKSEHQVFTNAWRSIFPHGMDYTDVTIDMLWDAAQVVYKDYPELLDAAKTILFG